jgi:hypothetical protein
MMNGSLIILVMMHLEEDEELLKRLSGGAFLIDMRYVTAAYE